MKRTLCLAALSACLAPVAVAAASTVLVPAGTVVPVHLVGIISSNTAKVGDTFQIQAAEDVVEHGLIVIPKGSGGQGEIVQSDSAGGSGHSGSLGLKFDYVHSADGGMIRLSDTTQTQSEEDRKGASSTATIIGFATFGIGGLFGHNLARGKEKKIDDTTVIKAFVARNVHVHATDRPAGDQFER